MIFIIFLLACLSTISAQTLASADQTTLLSIHNTARAKVFHPVTKLANPPVVWNSSLAVCALYWATQMLKQSTPVHSSSTTMAGGATYSFTYLNVKYTCKVPPNRAFGENLGWGSPTVPFRAFVDLWVGEAPLYHTKYKNESYTLAGVMEYGHYTQMAGRVVSSVGCGQAKNSVRIAFVCQYFKSANLLGRNITDMW